MASAISQRLAKVRLRDLIVRVWSPDDLALQANALFSYLLDRSAPRLEILFHKGGIVRRALEDI